MDQHNCEYQEPTDTPSTIPTAFQVSCDLTLHPECTHNLMAIQCNQYPSLSHNLALPQFLAHHKCEDLDPTDTPIAVPTAIQAPKDDTNNPKCAHNPQCNQSQYPILMKQNCTHNPSTNQVGKSNHSNPVAFPYPPDPVTWGPCFGNVCYTNCSCREGQTCSFQSSSTKRGDGKFFQVDLSFQESYFKHFMFW